MPFDMVDAKLFLVIGQPGKPYISLSLDHTYTKNNLLLLKSSDADLFPKKVDQSTICYFVMERDNSDKLEIIESIEILRNSTLNDALIYFAEGEYCHSIESLTDENQFDELNTYNEKMYAGIFNNKLYILPSKGQLNYIAYGIKNKNNAIIVGLLLLFFVFLFNIL
jgi:hypothetical protein